MMNPQIPAGECVGVEDGLERLWTPHRMAYIDSQHDRDGQTCPFCAAPGQTDEDGLIARRGATCFVVMNLFPYNPGHLLVCTYRHVADYTDLTGEETAEVAALTQEAMRVLRQTSAPAGFNLGINQGNVAGAGVADHFHQHVVPRWTGDANFFPIVAQTKAIPEILADTRRRLVQAWRS